MTSEQRRLFWQDHFTKCDTSQGARASAALYSVIETAKAKGLEHCAYLRKVFVALPAAQCVENVEALLSRNVIRVTRTDGSVIDISPQRVKEYLPVIPPKNHRAQK